MGPSRAATRRPSIARGPQPVDRARRARARRGALLLPLLKDGAWIAAFGAVCHAVLFNLSVVRGTSMAPGIADGDRVLIEDFGAWSPALERGDVVVLQSPVEPDVDYIKRVVALGGDEVLLVDGRVSVNGVALSEGYTIPGTAGLVQWLRVRPDEVFVLGDNRPHSSDSREFGPLDAALVRGRVRLRVWPLGRSGLLD